MRTKLSKKVLLSLGALGAAGAIAGMGTFATFTSTTSATQSVSSGNVEIALGATGTAANRLSVTATNVVPGDTIQRTVNLVSTSSEGLGSVALTTTAQTSSLLNTDATNGLQMVIDECPVAWTVVGDPLVNPTYTCATATSALATGSVIRSGVDLTGLSVLTAPGTSFLRITLTLPASADNTFESLTSVINYAFTGTQRAATAR